MEILIFLKNMQVSLLNVSFLFTLHMYLINYQFLIDEKDSHSNGDLPDLNDPELEIAASKIQSFWKRKKSNEPTGRFCYKQNNLFHLFSYLFFHPEYIHKSIIISGISNGNGKLSPRLDSGISTPQKN